MMEAALCLLVNLTLSVGTGWLGLNLTRRTPERMAGGLLLAAFLLLLFAAFGLRDRLFWAVLFPIPDVDLLCNCVAPATAFLAGVVGMRIGKTVPRCYGVAIVLCMIGFLVAYTNSLLPLPKVADKPEWRDGVLQQTSSATCGPASSVTLLHHQGIESTEQEMVTLCHTTDNGTSMLALLKGLSRKTATRSCRPIPITTTDVSEFHNIVQHGPVLISVLFTPVSGDRATILDSATHARHAVVVLRFLPDGSAEIGDPMQGKVFWSGQEFRQRWAGEGIQLLPKP